MVGVNDLSHIDNFEQFSQDLKDRLMYLIWKIDPYGHPAK